jgi:hypothetical protein
MTKSVLRRCFASTEEISAKAATALREALKNSFQECSQKAL